MLEENARAAIAASAAARAAEAERLSASLERVESRAARDVAQRGEEEKVLDAEAQAHARVAELRLQREADERERAHRAQLASRQQNMLLDAQRQQESWKTEDEERLLALKLSASTAERRAGEAGEAQRERELEASFLEAALKRETAMAAIERQRRLRHILEDERVRRDGELLARKRSAEVQRREEALSIEELVREHRAWRRDATAERLSTLNAERAKRVDEMTEHEARLLQLERTSHEREVEQMMLAQKQLEMEDALTEEKDLQEALIKLEQERVGERTDELRRAFLEDEQRQQAGFQQRLQEAEVQILAEERQRFELVREELAKRAAEREHTLGEEHRAKVAAHERATEQQAAGMHELLRRQVQRKEAAKVASQYTAGAPGLAGGAAAAQSPSDDDTGAGAGGAGVAQSPSDVLGDSASGSVRSPDDSEENAPGEASTGDDDSLLQRARETLQRY